MNICIQAEQSFYSKLNQKLNQKNNVQNLSQIFVEEIFYLLDKKTIYITNLVISWLILHFQIGYFSLLTLLKIRSFWNKGSFIMMSLGNFCTCSNHIADLIIWLKFDNSSISVREVIKISILYRFVENLDSFEGWCWFIFSYLGLKNCVILKPYYIIGK